MYKRILIGLAATMLSASAFAQLQVVSGVDAGAGPADPRPLSDAAKAQFEGLLPGLPGNGTIVTADLEALPVRASALEVMTDPLLV